jgi:hypothetical protein
MEDVMADALECKIDTFERIDRMLASTEGTSQQRATRD